MRPAPAVKCPQPENKLRLWIAIIGIVLMALIFLPACTAKPAGNTRLQADPWQVHLFIDNSTKRL